MLAAERQAVILRAVSEEGVLRVTSLAEDLGVSDVTIRRDIHQLTERGLVAKIHGGVARPQRQSTGFEPSFDETRKMEIASKKVIASRAKTLVSEGQSVALMGGSTVFSIANELLDTPGLTIVTNSLPTFQVLTSPGNPSHTVILSGGMHTPTHSLVGPPAVASFTQLSVDVVFLGCYGIDARVGLSTPNLLEAELNRTVIDRANNVCVVADPTKWGVSGLANFGTLEDIDTFITTDGLSVAAINTLRQRVGEVEVVPLPRATSAAS